MRYSDDNTRRRWARNLYNARVDRHLTQFQVSQALGIDQQRISKWERGLASPRDEMKFRLAAFYDVPTATLFPWDIEDNNGDDQAVA